MIEGQPSAAPQAEDARPCAKCRDDTPLFAFTLAFQPIIDLQEVRIDAYEALARGPNGEGAAHVLAQLTADTLYAFDQASRVKAIELAARLGMDRRLNINFQPNAVYSPAACIQTTLRAARRTGFPLDQLTFEIVEGEQISEIGHLSNIIGEYRRHGFQVALDDFATGYSGLARLAELGPDIIKIDRLLVKDCDHDKRRLAIVAGIIGLAREIGVKVVIEGVERIGEVIALREMGARFMQGFYFARPAFESLATDAMIAFDATGDAERPNAPNPTLM